MSKRCLITSRSMARHSALSHCDCAIAGIQTVLVPGTFPRPAATIGAWAMVVAMIRWWATPGRVLGARRATRANEAARPLQLGAIRCVGSVSHSFVLLQFTRVSFLTSPQSYLFALPPHHSDPSGSSHPLRTLVLTAAVAHTFVSNTRTVLCYSCFSLTHSLSLNCPKRLARRQTDSLGPQEKKN